MPPLLCTFRFIMQPATLCIKLKYKSAGLNYIDRGGANLTHCKYRSLVRDHDYSPNDTMRVKDSQFCGDILKQNIWSNWKIFGDAYTHFRHKETLKCYKHFFGCILTCRHFVHLDCRKLCINLYQPLQSTTVFRT